MKMDKVWGPERAAPDALGHVGFSAKNERLITFQTCLKVNGDFDFKPQMIYLWPWDLGCVSSFPFSCVRDCTWRVALGGSYILRVFWILSHPGGYFLPFFFFFLLRLDGGEWEGLALMRYHRSHTGKIWSPPPIQQRPFNWKGLSAQKGECAFCHCQSW